MIIGEDMWSIIDRRRGREGVQFFGARSWFGCDVSSRHRVDVQLLQSVVVCRFHPVVSLCHDGPRFSVYIAIFCQEFIFFNERQVLPEYAVIYKRQYDVNKVLQRLWMVQERIVLVSCSFIPHLSHPAVCERRR